MRHVCRIRPENVSAVWLRFPYKNPPATARLGWRDLVKRYAVTWHCPGRDARPLNDIRYADLNPDERWAVVVTNRTRMLAAVYYDEALDAEVDKRLVRRAYGCTPPGYNFLYRIKHERRCGSSECPYCQARRAAEAFVELRRVFFRRPADKPLWLGKLRGDGDLKAVKRRVDRLRPAGAVASLTPKSDGAGGLNWSYEVLAASDDPKRAGDAPVEVTRVGQLVRPVVRLFAKRARPRCDRLVHLCEMIRVDGLIPEGARTVASYGACRESGWTPGKGLLDFAANEPTPA